MAEFPTMAFIPIFVDFSVSPLRTNAGVRKDGAGQAGDHWNIDARGRVYVDFPSDGPGDEVTLMIRALVSRLGQDRGHSPLDVFLNDHSVISGYRLPGGGDLPQDVAFSIDGGWLRNGTNTLELRTAGDATSMLWLYRVFLESVGDRGAAERALLDDAVTELALTYLTETCDAESGDWQRGPELRLLIDNEKVTLPSRLAWRCGDGSQAAIIFALELTTFLGHLRNREGKWFLYRGQLTGRGSEPGGSVRQFRTEVSWGTLTTWHQAGKLSLYLDTGYGEVEQVGWLDGRGNSASIGFTDNGEAFSGYAQNANEGPIAFRGKAVSPGFDYPSGDC
jgi:hypothetical protein